MKPAAFDYVAAATLGDASNTLARDDSSTKVIAGAQSLGPMLNLRLIRPSKLIDVSMLPDLRGVRETVNGVEIGAAITHAEIEDGEVPDPTSGWLQAAAANIAHRAVRNRGTLGGSLAHADPAADWVLVMTGLCATVLLDGPAGKREVAMTDFITGPFETALRSGEIISAVRIARPSSDARWGYWKFMRQVGEFAKASATVLIDAAAGTSRIAVGALGRQPLVLNPALTDDLISGSTSAGEVLSQALPQRPSSELAMHSAALTRALLLAKGDGEPQQ